MVRLPLGQVFEAWFSTSVIHRRCCTRGDAESSSSTSFTGEVDRAGLKKRKFKKKRKLKKKKKKKKNKKKQQVIWLGRCFA